MDQNLTVLLHSVLCSNDFLIPVVIWIRFIVLVWLFPNWAWHVTMWWVLFMIGGAIYCKIHGRGAPLTNCWGFVDGTVRPISGSERNSRVLYNGHKKVHGIKFQSVAAPNGLIANLFGPVERRRHDSAMLAGSELLQMLERYSIVRDGSILCIYGDSACPWGHNSKDHFGQHR